MVRELPMYARLKLKMNFNSAYGQAKEEDSDDA